MLFNKNITDEEYLIYENGVIKAFKLSEIKTEYIILIFYPFNFTFVCPTELIRFSEMHEEFKNENSTIIFVSVDSVYSHKAWSSMKIEDGGIGKMNWPMLSDVKRKLANQFDLISDSGAYGRATIIINNKFNIKHISINSDNIGRSSKEILRLIKALNFNSKNDEICPVDFDL